MWSTVDVDLSVTDNDISGVNVSKQTLTVVVEEHDREQLHGGALCPADGGCDGDGRGALRHERDPRPPITLTFTPQNWNTPKTVTVTAGEDDDAAHDTVTLTHSATSHRYRLPEASRLPAWP